MPLHPLLYSTNVFLKLFICEQYAGDIHYAWCSEVFDATALGRYTSAAQVPPSSNPADIYKELRSAVQRRDRHCYKINEQKVVLKNLAIRWEGKALITSDQRDEIIYLVDNATFEDWRPLLYAIPRQSVAGRLISVPVHQRASLGMEFIIPDLRRSEFDILEL